MSVPRRVLHAPEDIAGQASAAVAGLRRIGIEADLYAASHPFDYGLPDIVPPTGRAALSRVILRAATSYDTFHFHFGQSFHTRFRLADARMLRAWGRRVVVEFHGSEVRLPSLEAARNPYYVKLEGEDDACAHRLMERWSKITEGHVIVCDRSLIPGIRQHFDHIHIASARVDVTKLAPIPPDPTRIGPLVIVHAPSNERAKGTTYLRAAIAKLDEVEYVEISKRSRAQALAAFARADIVVDQLCMGGYGVASIEAMSMAKPVVCYLLPEYRRADCPIIQADPDTVFAVLADWVQRRSELRAVGLASRAFVERYHDVPYVARLLLDTYRALPARVGRARTWS